MAKSKIFNWFKNLLQVKFTLFILIVCIVVVIVARPLIFFQGQLTMSVINFIVLIGILYQLNKIGVILYKVAPLITDLARIHLNRTN